MLGCCASEPEATPPRSPSRTDLQTEAEAEAAGDDGQGPDWLYGDYQVLVVTWYR